LGDRHYPPAAHRRILASGTESALARSGLKAAWEDGTTAVVLGPVELLKRLAAVVPHPRVNLTVYRGVLAGNHRWRSQVVPMARADAPRGERRSGWIVWSELMRRTFGVDVLSCRRCGARLVVRAVVRSREVACKLLGVQGLAWEPEQLERRPLGRGAWEEAEFW
jgi:hypothetical protein